MWTTTPWKVLVNNKIKAQTPTRNPIGNLRCHVLASCALNMPCSFSQWARSIESRCALNDKSSLVEAKAWCTKDDSLFWHICASPELNTLAGYNPIYHYWKWVNAVKYLLWFIVVLWRHRASENLVKSRSGNSLVPFYPNQCYLINHYPDSKVHGANMGPIWGRQWGLLAVTWELFYRRCSRYISLIWIWTLLM